MRAPFLLLLVAQWAAASDETLSAAECVLQFSTDEDSDRCRVISQFARCIAESPDEPGTKNVKKSLALLEEAQKKEKGCDINVAPQIRVVNREVSLASDRGWQAGCAASW